MENLIEKSEILFIYEGKYTVPNGDPFTGEQRYDDKTKQILVSDVRIKRYVRDYFIQQNTLGENEYEVFVFNDKSQVKEGSKESGASARMKSLRAKYKDTKTSIELLKKCIDVRLFGGISTEEKAAVNITGPVQFALLNPSLNKVDLRMHQNTSVFVSSTDNSRGAIGTTTVVPYCVNQIHGWINPYSALDSGLTGKEIKELFAAMWNSVNNVNTRSKSNQNSLLLIQLVYHAANEKVYGVDKLISYTSDKEDEQLRDISDFSFDFSKLNETANSDKIKEVRYYTELDSIKEELEKLNNKKIKFTPFNKLK